MDTANFLARVVPPGNYLAISHNKTPGARGGFQVRMFPYGSFTEAAGYAAWGASKGWDTYHSNASFITAETAGADKRGNPKFKGSKDAANVMSVKAFWIDFDVSRPGDKKTVQQCYPTQAAALVWLTSFIKAVGLPRPNLAVNSGYGLHVYWVLEDAMTPAAWTPYGLALRSALIANGFLGDAGISSDVARILRPPGTVNAKVAPHVQVTALPRLSGADVPNQLMLAALTPFLGVAAVRTATSMSAAGASSGTAVALAGGGASVTSIFASAGTRTPNMGSAAQANLPVRSAPREMSKIATRCLQVASSLANRGATDTYPLWYLGHLTLAHFCSDGPAHAHALSDGHPAYQPASVDAAMQQIAGEVARKQSGPPTCDHYERARPGVCGGCPFFKQIKTPWELGVDQDDLPPHYRRASGSIEVEVRDQQSKDWVWWPLVQGDLRDPVLDQLPGGGHALTFTYELQGISYTVRVDTDELGSDGGTIFRLFARKMITLSPGSELRFRGFIVEWIRLLRERRKTRADIVHPFGWHTKASNFLGFAVGGTLYMPDGTSAPVGGGDGQMVSMYSETGDLDAWKRAAALVSAGRPDLQAIIATSFGAPLMQLMGYQGIVFSAWSRMGGEGKSSAIAVGQGVWGDPRGTNALNDTVNSVMRKISELRALPCYYDEVRVVKANEADFVNHIFMLTQGKEKSRMTRDNAVREVGEWHTILMLASNRPMMDMVLGATQGTDAGALRCFEWEVSKPARPMDPAAHPIISAAKTNYGSAGRIYAAFLAANSAKIQAALAHTLAALTAERKAEQSERLFIAGMAACIVGASIANRLKLVPFDMPALRSFFATTFDSLRAMRKLDVAVSGGGYDLHQLFGNFMADNMGRRIVTNTFARPGPTGRVEVLWHPQDRQHVDIQVSQHDRMIRVSRVAFTEWCRRKDLPGRDVVQALIISWKAMERRSVLAAGTGYTGGQIYVLDVPVTSSDLEPYLYLDGAATAASAATAAALSHPVAPKSATKGNTPTTP